MSRSRLLDPSFDKYVLLMNLRSFWSSVKSVNDPDQIWFHLRKGGTKERQGVHLCQKFLGIYATHRKRFRVSLGPEEKEAKRAVNHGRTLLNIWRILVLHFNRTVLVRKRRENPADAAQWDLRFKEGVFSKKGQGPVYEIVRVCHPLAIIFTLNLQAFELLTSRHLVDRS